MARPSSGARPESPTPGITGTVLAPALALTILSSTALVIALTGKPYAALAGLAFSLLVLIPLAAAVLRRAVEHHRAWSVVSEIGGDRNRSRRDRQNGA